MSVRTFDSHDSLLTWGAELAQDFSQGEYIHVEFEDQWVDAPSAGGGGTRVKTNNKWATITITLQNGSPTNDVWGANAAAGNALPLYFQHNNFKLTAVTAWCKKIPDGVFSNSDDGGRQYVLRTENADCQPGSA